MQAFDPTDLEEIKYKNLTIFKSAAAFNFCLALIRNAVVCRHTDLHQEDEDAQCFKPFHTGGLLHCASQCGVSAVRCLTAARDFDVGAKDALARGCFDGRAEVIRVLAELLVDLAARSANGGTPLHLAARGGSRSDLPDFPKAIRTLIALRVDVLARNPSGRTDPAGGGSLHDGRGGTRGRPSRRRAPPFAGRRPGRRLRPRILRRGRPLLLRRTAARCRRAVGPFYPSGDSRVRSGTPRDWGRGVGRRPGCAAGPDPSLRGCGSTSPRPRGKLPRLRGLRWPWGLKLPRAGPLALSESPSPSHPLRATLSESTLSSEFPPRVGFLNPRRVYPPAGPDGRPSRPAGQPAPLPIRTAGQQLATRQRAAGVRGRAAGRRWRLLSLSLSLSLSLP